MIEKLLALAEAVNRECTVETRRWTYTGGNCILAMGVVCDVLNSFELRTEPLQLIAVVQGDPSPIDKNYDGVTLGARIGDKFAGHWVTIVEGHFLVDPTLGQARTKKNPQLEVRPLAIDLGAFTFNQNGEAMALELELSANTTVTYKPATFAIDLNKSAWWTSTNPRKRIASRMKRQFKELLSGTLMEV